jgi:hypothetical protein
MKKITAIGMVLAVGFVLGGCETTGMPWSGSSSKESKSEVKTEETKKEAKAGSQCNKPVSDSTKAEAGQGCTLKGMGDWEGEISGVPVAGSKFSKLKIGMPMRQVKDLAGEASDEGAYVTGKAWIPFYFGSDRHRYEMVYKNSGRLIFAGGGMGDLSSGHLIWIIHNKNEPAYR